MSKHKKRIQRARNNPKSVSYEDFISILEKEGYTIRQGKGSHQVASKKISEATFVITFTKPHGNKKSMNPREVKLLLEQIDNMEELEMDNDNE